MNQIKNGIDILLQNPARWLKHRRVGLITNASSVTADLHPNIDALRAAGANLVALFGPEHGFSMAAADAEKIASGIDARTGLPVFSLYGDVRKPTREMLTNVDVVLYDLQDVGVRFYTYTATLALALEACAEFGKPMIMLDRPNPINGNIIEGAVLDPALQSFVGHGPLPIRYGMTLGELAQFYNRELNINAELEIVAMDGWRREMWFDDTGLSWVPTSPNIPNFLTTIVYPGMCFVEGTNMSEGRGTGLPFENIGAPWLDGFALAEELNARRIDGVGFRPTAFTPTTSKHNGQVCGGVQVHVIDRNALRAVEMGLHVIDACRKIAPKHFEFLPSSWEGRPAHFDLLSGDKNTRAALIANQSIESVIKSWNENLRAFDEKRRKYLIY